MREANLGSADLITPVPAPVDRGYQNVYVPPRRSRKLGGGRNGAVGQIVEQVDAGPVVVCGPLGRYPAAPVSEREDQYPDAIFNLDDRWRLRLGRVAASAGALYAGPI